MKNTISAFFAIFPWLNRSRNSGGELVVGFHAEHNVRVVEHVVGGVRAQVRVQAHVPVPGPVSTAYQCRNPIFRALLHASPYDAKREVREECFCLCRKDVSRDTLHYVRERERMMRKAEMAIDDDDDNDDVYCAWIIAHF